MGYSEIRSPLHLQVAHPSPWRSCALRSGPKLTSPVKMPAKELRWTKHWRPDPWPPARITMGKWCRHRYVRIIHTYITLHCIALITLHYITYIHPGRQTDGQTYIYIYIFKEWCYNYIYIYICVWLYACVRERDYTSARRSASDHIFLQMSSCRCWLRGRPWKWWFSKEWHRGLIRYTHGNCQFFVWRILKQWLINPCFLGTLFSDKPIIFHGKWPSFRWLAHQ